MYKILEIDLKDYKRLQLSHIKHFKATFTNRDQIIIGTNGSGKSSLFHELSPLPPDHQQYDKTGHKSIKISKDNSVYEINTVFNPKIIHSFKKDGIELNESGLVTLQKELVKQHLGIDEEIHNLMLGKIQFTKMSTNERRKWFTLLSDANYEYLINVYLKYKDIVRDITGGLRLAKNKLVAETSKVLKDEEVAILKKEVEDLYELIEYLSEKRLPIDQDINQIKEEREQLLLEISNIKDKIFKNKFVFKYGYLNEIHKLDNQHNELFIKLNICQNKSKEYFKEFNELNEVYKLLEKTQLEHTVEINKYIEDIKNEIKQTKNKKIFNHINEYPENALSTLNHIKKDLFSLLELLDTNPNKTKYNKDDFNKLNQNILTKQEIIYHIKSNIDKLEASKKHYIEHHESSEVVCPECNHKWRYVFGSNEIDKIEKQLKDLYTKLDTNEKELKLLLEDKDTFIKYSDTYKQIKNIISYSDNLNYFWSTILEKDLLDNSPIQIQNQLLLLEKDLLLDKKILNLDKELKDYLQKVELNKLLEDKDYLTVKKNLDLLEEKIYKNDKEISLLENKIKDIQLVIDIANELKEYQDKLEKYNHELDLLTKDIIELYRRNSFNKILRDLQSLLAQKEKLLNDSNNQIKYIDTIKKEIEDLTEQEKVLKIGLKVLSPTEGLIAKGLIGFIKVFVENMNQVISKIWSYPLLIQPCQYDKEDTIDLNYKFPILVDTDKSIRKDVSQGSSSMLEVIDLAFRICALKALKMDDMPLFLDEFGKTMDSVHKRSTIRLIESLMENERFSQMFLISHDLSQYGGLAHSEICVLNELNVILPTNSIYNQHVKMS